MTYKTLMVHVALGQPNGPLLKLTGDLARRLSAGVIGIAAAQPMQILFGDGTPYDGAIFEQDRADRAAEIEAAEAEFRAAFHGHQGAVGWRSSYGIAPLSDTVARAGRCADLIITGVTSGEFLNAEPPMSTGELLMQAGRPVLTVPLGTGALPLQHVILAWKDTRETRRAALDALPLLQLAHQITIIEIAATSDLADATARLQDVADWLSSHGVKADQLAVPRAKDDGAVLQAIAREQGADLIVAGAYGHSRVREWALGGVTRELLLHGSRCALLSH